MTSSSGKFSHLNPAVLEIIQADFAERRQFMMRPRWIGYPRALEVLEHIRSLVSHPPVRRMPLALIVGPTNNGKTMIIESFEKEFPPDMALDEDAAKIPVVSIEMPPHPDVRQLFCSILSTLQANFSAKDSLTYLRHQVQNHLAVFQTRVLVIDEFHNMLSGRTDKQREFLNELRTLSQHLRMSLVCAGTKEAFSAVSIDPQLENRFSYQTLSRWTDGETLRRFLKTLESVLPLREPSALASDEFAPKLLDISEGLIGEMVTLVIRCACLAIKQGREAISVDDFDRLRALPPSRRRAAAEREVPV